MLWVPQKGRLRVEHNTGTTAVTSPPTACTTGGAASTKGTPVQIFASTSFDAYLIQILCFNYSATTTASEGAIDILIGASTEEVLIPNLLMGNCPSGTAGLRVGGGKRWTFPLYIPAGSRIAIQSAGARTSTAMNTCIYLFGGDGTPEFQVGRKVTTYGMGTVPNGTAVTPSSGGEGAWTQITASTTEDHFAVFPSFQAETSTAMNAGQHVMDIGMGAATEEEMFQSFWFSESGNEDMAGPFPDIPAFFSIPSGSRLVARDSASGSLDTRYGVALHCVS